MPSLVSLIDITKYHSDAEASLRLYFSDVSPAFPQRFFSDKPSEIASELSERINETDMRSVLVTLARVEAALRQDYVRRCKDKLSDDISIAFRKNHRAARGRRPRLDEDILNIWAINLDTTERGVISTLRRMFKFRHWMAHGRYWNVGTVHSFQDVYPVADLTISILKLHE